MVPTALHDAAVVARLLGLPLEDVERLISRIGTVGDLLCATSDRVLALAGLDAAKAHADLRSAILIATRADLTGRPILDCPAAVASFLRVLIGRQRREQVHAFYADAGQRLLVDEPISLGTLSEAPIYPREIMRRALEVGAASVIIAHNHPSGDAKPSDADIRATKAVAAAGRLLGVELLDHVIITRTACTSMRRDGLI